MSGKERTQDHTYNARQDMIWEGSPVDPDIEEPAFFKRLPTQNKAQPETLGPQIFAQYGIEFFSNSATRDLSRLISEVQLDISTIKGACLEYIRSHRTGVFKKGVLRGVVSEVILKMAIDQIVKSDPRYAQFPDEWVVGNKKLSRNEDRLGGYTYYERRTSKTSPNSERWVYTKEYDGIVLAKNAYGEYKPVVLELKTSQLSWSNSGINTAMSPGKVEAKLEPLQSFFSEGLGYGVVGMRKRVSERSPLQRHFAENGGFVAAFPLSEVQLSSIVDEVGELTQ